MRLPACCGSVPGAKGPSILEGGQCMSSKLSMAVHSDKAVGEAELRVPAAPSGWPSPTTH